MRWTVGEQLQREQSLLHNLTPLQPLRWSVNLKSMATTNVFLQGFCEDSSTAPSTSQDSF